MTHATILLVEDTADDVFLMLRATQQIGLPHELVVKPDGTEALQWLHRTGAHAGRLEADPALILLDLKLPGLGGLEVLKRIRADASTRRIPVVILTSSSVPEDIRSAYDLGANSFIQKPVDFKRFVQALQNLATYWLELNVPAPT